MRFLIGVAWILLSVSSKAYATMDFDKKYDCLTVVAPGGLGSARSTTTPITLNDLRSTGVIQLENSPMIDFYGTLKVLNTAPVDSDYITLAKTTGEIQGSIKIEPEENDRISLKIAIMQMDRAYDKLSGQQVFVISGAGSFLQMICSAH